MKEKIMKFIKNEKINKCIKRVLNKNTLKILIAIFVVISVLRITFSLMFEVKGTVKSIDGQNITIVNFFNTKTVDVGNYPIELQPIQIGDRIEIGKNLSGDILYIRDEDRNHKNENISIGDSGKQKSKENRKNNRIGKN